MKQKKCILLTIFILTTTAFGCSSNQYKTVLLYSKDKSQVVTIFSDYENKTRIIAEGKKNQKPNDNYAILDISNITDENAELGICWKINGWELVNDGTTITENNLDANKYIIRTEWFKDEREI